MTELKKIIPDIVKALDLFKNKGLVKNYVLIGGMAVAARGVPRATKDLDFLINTDEDLFRKELTGQLKTLGFTAKSYKGGSDDPLRGLIRIFDEDENPIVDLILIHWKWQEDIVNSAQILKLEDVSIPVARAEDLIVLKLKAGSTRDLLDAEELIKVASYANSLNKPHLLSLSKRAGVDRKLKQIISFADKNHK